MIAGMKPLLGPAGRSKDRPPDGFSHLVLLRKARNLAELRSPGNHQTLKPNPERGLQVRFPVAVFLRLPHRLGLELLADCFGFRVQGLGLIGFIGFRAQDAGL